MACKLLQEVVFHYAAYNESGRRIDSSYLKGQPARTRMGIQGLIPGEAPLHSHCSRFLLLQGLLQRPTRSAFCIWHEVNAELVPAALRPELPGPKSSHKQQGFRCWRRLRAGPPVNARGRQAAHGGAAGAGASHRPLHLLQREAVRGARQRTVWK